MCILALFIAKTSGVRSNYSNKAIRTANQILSLHNFNKNSRQRNVFIKINPHLKIVNIPVPIL